MKELEELIEKNRARPDTRVQHRWAHEHLTIGPLAHLSCQGAKFFGSSGKRLERLLCFVDNWQLYSASLAVNVDLREPNVTEADIKRRKQLQYEISRSKQPNKELEEFLGRLKPYVSLQIDEPQFSRKYPLLNQPTRDDTNRLWPTSNDCQRQFPHGTPSVSARYADEADLPQMFISPENKGYS
ncbi:TPR Domain containing protein [Aphelenchoides avenae]|nr:TPR Domain containing protein [Aphelenchus avenae]